MKARISKAPTKPASKAAIAWWIVGGIATFGAIKMFLGQLPSMRRELKLLRM